MENSEGQLEDIGKPWWESKGVAGSVLSGAMSVMTFVSLIFLMRGHPLTPADQQFIVSQIVIVWTAFVSVIGVVASIVSWYGRVFATTTIDKRRVL